MTAPTPPIPPTDRDLTGDIPAELIEKAKGALVGHEGSTFPDLYEHEAEQVVRAVLAVVAGPLRAEALRDAAADWHEPHDPTTYPASDWLTARADRIEES